MRRENGQHGQTMTLVPVAVVLMALLVGGLVRLGSQVIAAAEAQSVADAAALAGAAGGQAEAAATAAANGAVLVRFEVRGAAVQVDVEREGQRATAAAERYRPSAGAGARSGHDPTTSADQGAV